MRLVDTDATDRKLFYKQCMGKDSLISVESAYDMLMALPEVKAVPIETLDKIRAEIKALSPEPTAYDVVDGNPIKDAVWETLADVLQIIDKYKAESEGKE